MVPVACRPGLLGPPAGSRPFMVRKYLQLLSSHVHPLCSQCSEGAGRRPGLLALMSRTDSKVGWRPRDRQLEGVGGGAGRGGTCICWGTSARSPCTRGLAHHRPHRGPQV